jgi:hypothetical protein
MTVLHVIGDAEAPGAEGWLVTNADTAWQAVATRDDTAFMHCGGASVGTWQTFQLDGPLDHLVDLRTIPINIRARREGEMDAESGTNRLYVQVMDDQGDIHNSISWSLAHLSEDWTDYAIFHENAGVIAAGGSVLSAVLIQYQSANGNTGEAQISYVSVGHEPAAVVPVEPAVLVGTVRESIIQGLVTQLNTGTPAGVPAAQRTRLAALQVGELPSIIVFPLSEEPEIQGGNRGPLVRATLTTAIECRGKGSATLRPDQAVDPLLAWVVKALGGRRLSDGAGGHLTHPIKEGRTTWRYEFADDALCLATVELEVPYQHLVADAERRI